MAKTKMSATDAPEFHSVREGRGMHTSWHT